MLMCRRAGRAAWASRTTCGRPSGSSAPCCWALRRLNFLPPTHATAVLAARKTLGSRVPIAAPRTQLYLHRGDCHHGESTLGISSRGRARSQMDILCRPDRVLGPGHLRLQHSAPVSLPACSARRHSVDHSAHPGSPHCIQAVGPGACQAGSRPAAQGWQARLPALVANYLSTVWHPVRHMRLGLGFKPPWQGLPWTLASRHSCPPTPWNQGGSQDGRGEEYSALVGFEPHCEDRRRSSALSRASFRRLAMEGQRSPSFGVFPAK